MQHRKSNIRIALAGNPNSGKTTVFNRLTGDRQHVGNYPGVTVEKKEGVCEFDGVRIDVVDLPGTYSLTAYTLDEVVARNYLMEDPPDLVVDIVDASSLERNFYLTVQLLELGIPIVLVLNMSDVARSRGLKIDAPLLSELLGTPVVSTIGHKGRGIEDLQQTIVAVAEGQLPVGKLHIDYGRDVEPRLSQLQSRLEENEKELSDRYGSRWLAIKLLENDEDVRGKITSQDVLKEAEQLAGEIQQHAGHVPEVLISGARYGVISGVAQETVRSTVEAAHNLSDRIDKVLLSRLLGLPIFFLLMYLVFQLTFTVGAIPMGWIESLFGWAGGAVAGWWAPGSESVLKSLIVEGMIGGVGGVISFLPNVLLLFLAIAVLEDSGYMARAAFLMDRPMHKIGLHGKSFIPMLIGFGCSVPAILATRTLESRKDRLVTMLVTPLMSCGARLPIYALIIPAFFPEKIHGTMLWLIYVIGIAVAVLSARLLRLTVLPGESTPFVMELPPYHVPHLHGVMVHTWERAWMYLKKAGTLILGASIVLWATTSYPKKVHLDRDYQAEARRAVETFREDVKALNGSLGLPEDSDVLVNAVGLKSGEKSLPPESPEPVKRLVEVRSDIVGIRKSFDEEVRQGRLVAGSPEYETHESLRDTSLALLRKTDPHVFAAAMQVVDEMAPTLENARNEISQSRRAEELTYSISGRIGKALEPVLKPLGFDWRIATALVGAFAAKEVFVAQLGIVFSVGEGQETSEALRLKLRKQYTPLVGFCIMLFCLITCPCVATLAVTRSESESWKWMLFQMAGLSGMAYVITLIVFQVGTLLKIGVG